MRTFLLLFTALTNSRLKKLHEKKKKIHWNSLLVSINSQNVLFFLLQFAMARNMLVKSLLVLLIVEVLLVSVSEGKPWWSSSRRRRRRRRARPPSCDSSRPSGVAWVNDWQQYFSHYCPSSK